MRIYMTFQEALSEIKRDLKEMGILTRTTTYQDKIIGDDPRFDTFELQDYIYRVIHPSAKDLNPTQPWADKEFLERVTSPGVNPGEAWKERPEIWEEFLNTEGRFSYTYAERIHQVHQIDHIIRTLKTDPLSRQAFISIWSPADSARTGGLTRIPCTLGYYFQIRRGALNITYLQRSSDFVTHFSNDLYLAHKLQSYIAGSLGYPVGVFTHWVGSLHIFNKDTEGVF